MSGPTIIGKPTIIVVDDSSDWIEQLEFSLGDKYLIIATSDLETAAEIARRHWPEVMLLDWQIARRDPERARIGIARENEEALR